MNALLKHQILNAAADADRRKLPSLAAVLTDALAELERLAPFEPVTLFVAEPVVARRHEIASEQTDEMMAQAAPVTVGDGEARIDPVYAGAYSDGWQAALASQAAPSAPDAADRALSDKAWSQHMDDLDVLAAAPSAPDAAKGESV